MRKREPSTKTAVLLDTEVYERLGWYFENPTLQQLLEFVKDGDLELLTTDVINNEIKAHLKQKAHQVLSKCKGLASDLRKISNSEMILSASKALSQIAPQDFQDAIFAMFESFIERGAVRKIPIPKDALEAVLDDYFAILPPFGSGEKRKEFPDAISICAAQEFARREERTVIFVSHDGDIKAACERFSFLRSADSIDDVMEEMTKQRKLDRRLVSNVKRLLSKPPERLKHEIIEWLENIGSYWDGRQNEEVLAVYDFRVERLRNGRILRISRDKVIAAADALISFCADISRDVSPPDEESFFEEYQFDETLSRSAIIRVDFEIFFDSARDISKWNVIQVNWGEDLAVA